MPASKASVFTKSVPKTSPALIDRLQQDLSKFDDEESAIDAQIAELEKQRELLHERRSRNAPLRDYLRQVLVVVVTDDAPPEGTDTPAASESAENKGVTARPKQPAPQAEAKSPSRQQRYRERLREKKKDGADPNE